MARVTQWNLADLSTL